MVYSQELKHILALSKAIKDGKDEFAAIGCIVIDEASSTADSALDNVLAKRSAADRAKDPDTPTQPDYNTTTNMVRKTYAELFTLPDVHVILTSHTRKDKDNVGVEVQQPSFLPKLGQKLKQPLHLIGQVSGNLIEGGEGREPEYKRLIQVHPTRRVDAKTRIGGLPVQVEYKELESKVVQWLAGNGTTIQPRVVARDIDPEHVNDTPVEIEGD